MVGYPACGDEIQRLHRRGTVWEGMAALFRDWAQTITKIVITRPTPSGAERGPLTALARVVTSPAGLRPDTWTIPTH